MSTMSAVSTVEGVYQSRWGFHPCSYEEFLELKEAHKLLLRAYCDFKRHRRWGRKMEHNRSGPEPKFPGFLAEFGYQKLDKHFDSGFVFASSKDREGVKRNFYLQFLEEYRLARTPQEKAEDVRPLYLPDNWRDLIEKLRGFYQ